MLNAMTKFYRRQVQLTTELEAKPPLNPLFYAFRGRGARTHSRHKRILEILRDDGLEYRLGLRARAPYGIYAEKTSVRHNAGADDEPVRSHLRAAQRRQRHGDDDKVIQPTPPLPNGGSLQDGTPCFEPYGAFYVFPDISEFVMGDDKFAVPRLTRAPAASVPCVVHTQAAGCRVGQETRLTLAVRIGDFLCPLTRTAHSVGARYIR